MADAEVAAPAATPGSRPLIPDASSIRPLKDIEADYIEQAVALCGGNKTKAAELLGINVSTIHRRQKRG